MATLYGECGCGCRGKTNPSDRTQKSKGLKLGEPRRFLNGHALIKKDLYSVDPVTGCWVWNLAKMKNGYGIGRRPEGGQGLAHRIFYEKYKGPIPEGLDVDHLCRNRACVNPDHLEAKTHRENVLAGEAPSARLARSTHCPRGHEYTGKMRWSQISGYTRFCWKCRDMWKLQKKQETISSHG